MIIRSRNFAYEVIERLPDTAGGCHFRCRCMEDGAECHLVQLAGTSGMEEIPAVLELAENPAFTELGEYFLEGSFLYLVFPFPQGESLKRCLEEKQDWSAAERFAVGQAVLERIILLQIPEWLLAGILNTAAIYPEQEPVGFYYVFGTPGQEGLADIWEGLAVLTEALFAKELAGNLYPEIAAYQKQMTDGAPGDMMAAYQSYLELMPVCSEERKVPVKETVPFLKRVKKWKKQIATAFKLLMGAAVLLGAVTMVPKLWEEQIAPVVEAAALWKAVYVDGETLEAETEPETEPEPETSAEEPENGQVTRYWDNGSVCYKGAVVDGMYEGRGTLYYPNGGVEYQGEWEFGKKNGEGSLYTEEGILLYEGGFQRNHYEGTGKLYSEDNGNLIYDGEFSGGKYDGTGLLYDKWSEFPVYDGTFRRGFYDGAGVEYDGSGAPRYEGEFLLGVYHGYGVYYDTATGLVMMEGEFRNGSMVLLADLASDSDAEMADWFRWEGEQEYEGTDNAMVAPEKG